MFWGRRDIAPPKHPWTDGQDEPEVVLRKLAARAARDRGWPADVQAKLHHLVVEQREQLLQVGKAEHEVYQHERATHDTFGDRSGRHIWAFRGGLAGLRLSLGLFGFGLAAFGFLVTGGLPLWLRLPAAVLPAVSLAVLAERTQGWRWPRLFGVLTLVSAGGLLWAASTVLTPESAVAVVAGAALLAVVLARVSWWAADEFYDLDTAGQAMRAFIAWRELLYREAVSPLADKLAGDSGRVYATELDLPPHALLHLGASVDIETTTSRELRRLTAGPRGSFALAGPRGAGKSTMLDRWCAGHYLDGTRASVRVKVDAPVGYDPKEFLVHLFGRLCNEVEQQFPKSELATLARTKRAKIRYLQSRQVEGEIGADFSWGAKLAVKRKVAVKQDEVPLNFPELVDEFRAFLTEVAAEVARTKGRVLIGVDELDRISDGAQAERFINELKAVFGVPHVFFLVSVSEDALAEFELAAMGMRSAFDSAFDAVVRVDYLAFAEARRLVHLRVVNLPEQFAALAYVLSGGLARELLRIVEVLGTLSGPLAEVTAALTRRQLARTARAATDRLLRLPDRAAGTSLIPLLDTDPVPDLRAHATRLATAEVSEAAEPTRQDVTAMVEYLATVTETFTNTLDESRMSTGLTPGPGAFETLARIRRYLGASPHSARELLSAFDQAWR